MRNVKDAMTLKLGQKIIEVIVAHCFENEDGPIRDEFSESEDFKIRKMVWFLSERILHGTE